MVCRQDQRRAARHGQADDRIAAGGHTLVRGQIRRQLGGQEGLPLVVVRAAVAPCRALPVGVEAGHAADGHDHRQPGLVIVFERGGLDVPSAVVVAGAQPVEQVDRVGSTALELDGDIATHRRGRHHQRLDGKTGTRVRGSRRGTARDRDQPRQHQGDQGAGHRIGAPICSAIVICLHTFESVPHWLRSFDIGSTEPDARQLVRCCCFTPAVVTSAAGITRLPNMSTTDSPTLRLAMPVRRDRHICVIDCGCTLPGGPRRGASRRPVRSAGRTP